MYQLDAFVQVYFHLLHVFGCLILSIESIVVSYMYLDVWHFQLSLLPLLTCIWMFDTFNWIYCHFLYVFGCSTLSIESIVASCMYLDVWHFQLTLLPLLICIQIEYPVVHVYPFITTYNYSDRIPCDPCLYTYEMYCLKWSHEAMLCIWFYLHMKLKEALWSTCQISPQVHVITSNIWSTNQHTTSEIP